MLYSFMSHDFSQLIVLLQLSCREVGCYLWSYACWKLRAIDPLNTLVVS